MRHLIDPTAVSYTHLDVYKRQMEESLLKAVRSLETGVCHIYHKKFDDGTVYRMLSYIKEGTDAVSYTHLYPQSK